MTIAGKNEIYDWENRVGPILVHKLLGPRPPPPAFTWAQGIPARRAAVWCGPSRGSSGCGVTRPRGSLGRHSAHTEEACRSPCRPILRAREWGLPGTGRALFSGQVFSFFLGRLKNAGLQPPSVPLQPPTDTLQPPLVALQPPLEKAKQDHMYLGSAFALGTG